MPVMSSGIKTCTVVVAGEQETLQSWKKAAYSPLYQWKQRLLHFAKKKSWVTFEQKLPKSNIRSQASTGSRWKTIQTP